MNDGTTMFHNRKQSNRHQSHRHDESHCTSVAGKETQMTPKNFTNVLRSALMHEKTFSTVKTVTRESDTSFGVHPFSGDKVRVTVTPYYKVLTKPLTIPEIEAMFEKSNISGVVAVPLDEVIDNDYDYLMDNERGLVHIEVTGDPSFWMEATASK